LRLEYELLEAIGMSKAPSTIQDLKAIRQAFEEDDPARLQPKKRPSVI
jgi:hypothetical protein